MKWYKTLKDLPFIPAGTIFDENWMGTDMLEIAIIKTLLKDDQFDTLIWDWYEEIIEEKKEEEYEWLNIEDIKIWDKVIKVSIDGLIARTIVSNLPLDWNFRKPTQEELEKYWR